MWITFSEEIKKRENHHFGDRLKTYSLTDFFTGIGICNFRFRKNVSSQDVVEALHLY